MQPIGRTASGVPGGWVLTSSAGARYVRTDVRDHPLVHALWVRRDPPTAASSSFGVARAHPTVTVALTGTGVAQVAIRPVGEVVAATWSPAVVAVELHPWAGPRAVHDLAGRVEVDRIGAELSGRGDGAAARLLLATASAVPVDPDPVAATIVQAIIAAPGDRAVARSGPSERSVRRLVRAATGTTPGRLRRAARAGLARELIRRTGLPLAQVAVVAGYADQSHMTNDFRDLCGYTPLGWRRHTADWTAGG